MELNDVIKNRRSIRKFKSIPVPQSIIIEALRYGTLAPSAHNKQPWKFKILTPEEKNHIAKLLYEKTKDISGHTGPHTSTVIESAQELVLVFLDSDNKSRDMDVISVGACIENIILYLTNLNIGTLWIGNTNLINDEIKEYLNIEYNTISSLAIGYKDQEPHERPRKNFDDVIIK